MQRFSLACLTLFCCVSAQADLVPSGNSPFYYKLGGEQNAPVPAYNGAWSMPLGVDGDVGLGYNCGLFNPALSITNSLNSIENSFQNIEQSVVQNATAAISEFPLYAISRADPDLYNLLNNALLGARQDLSMSTKSCQTMQQEIGQQQNPYTDWATLSMGNTWKYHMSLANNGSSLAASSDSNNQDINVVNQQVANDNGDAGVPWVQGQSISHHGVYAGGKDQPAIQVVHDTSVAGYNVILQSGRSNGDTSAPAMTSSNAHLVNTWNNPVVAANWITQVVGDETITTYSNGAKSSTPGTGLLSIEQQKTQTITPLIQALVSGKTPSTIENLKSVSAPGVMINGAVIQAMQQKDAVTQTILINKLSQEIATAQVIDEALLGKQILQEGSQVPAIYGNKAAQSSINQAISRLDQAINNLLFDVRVRKELVSDTASQLLESTAVEQQGNSLVQPSTPAPNLMNKGALSS